MTDLRWQPQGPYTYINKRLTNGFYLPPLCPLPACSTKTKHSKNTVNLAQFGGGLVLTPRYSRAACLCSYRGQLSITETSVAPPGILFSINISPLGVVILNLTTPVLADANIRWLIGIQALNQAISHGAMRDSSERDPPPRCHPGTREKAAEDIIRWIEEPNPSSSVLWVNGRAGVGKSVLMQKLAERAGAYYGGCFFFRRGVPGCNQKGFLFSTVAYQLAMNVPGMHEHLDSAMSKDSSLPRMSAAVQVERLIVEPIKLVRPILPHLLIIIIDGLDECEDHDSQRDILKLVVRVSMDPSVPFRFIIASRPEHQICSIFNEQPLCSMTRRLVLDEEYDSASDIQSYLHDKFMEIHTRNRDIMDQISPWPSEGDLRTLVAWASGQFIYASTVIKFVGSVGDLLSPQEKLNIILNPGPMQASAFSELDRQYTQILSAHDDSKVLVHVLGVVLALEALKGGIYSNDESLTNPEVIANIAGLGQGKVLLVLRALQSVTKIQIKPIYDDCDDEQPNNIIDQRVQLSHRSFHDFLTDKARSGPYFVNIELSIGQIFCRILDLATASLRKMKR